MKRIIIFAALIFATMTSCNIEDDDSQNFFFEIVPIQSVEVPEEFIHGETYEISVSYNRPNDCYEFNDFIYGIDDNERTVAVVNTVYTNIECNEVPELITVNFDLVVVSTETYVFKFYQGSDGQGQDQYLLVEVPVVE
ncbi:hypothetical protein [Winogradskyella sp. PE311]|uniref:hypothetical protein n=1 Tax=Winogradskyella sp. PE311 TaxID=3366943 RepID=UPI00397F6A56